jgi:TonB family protein
MFLLFRAIRTPGPASSAFTPQSVSAAPSARGPETAADQPLVSHEHLRRRERHSARIERGTGSGHTNPPHAAPEDSATAASDAAPSPPPAALISAQASAPDSWPQLVSSLPSEQPALPRRLRVSSGVPEPMLLHRVEPLYPALAKQNGVEGAVVLQAVVNAKGQVTNLRIRSGNSLLAAAAVRAVQQWRYRPALLNGDPIDIPIQITLKFELPK